MNKEVFEPIIAETLTGCLSEAELAAEQRVSMRRTLFLSLIQQV
jgi:hypothetical protein